MKKLFYRLSCRRSFAKFFSLLAIAMVASAVATEAQAQWWGSGGASWFGSDFTAVIKLGDYNATLTSSVCGTGFIDTVTNSNEQQGQRIDCTLIENGVETPAQCEFSNLQCSCFKVGTCTGGTRTSTMTCPTLDPITKKNEAGCRGTISVFDLQGNPLHADVVVGSNPQLDDLTNDGKCGQEFKKGSGFNKGEMGTLKQECQGNSNPLTDLVLEEKVRSTNGYVSTTEWRNAIQTGVDCNPLDGFPTNACTNSSGVSMKFPLAPGDQCVTSNFSCGQLTGTSGPVDGPRPSKCGLDKNTGLCECRCDRCTPQGALVNVGIGDQGLFVLHSADNAYACQVRVVH
jgi:hypothetical protein